MRGVQVYRAVVTHTGSEQVQHGRRTVKRAAEVAELAGRIVVARRSLLPRVRTTTASGRTQNQLTERASLANLHGSSVWPETDHRVPDAMGQSRRFEIMRAESCASAADR